MDVASLNVACPGLLRKPLDATIGRLLAAARMTINKPTMKNTPTLQVILMAIAMRPYYRPHHPIEEVKGFPKATKRHHRASTLSDIINQTCLPLILG